MPINKFNQPEPERAPDETPKMSRFDPRTQPTDAQSPLGERVYQHGAVNDEGTYTDQNELMEALMMRFENAFDHAESIVKAYEKAIRKPTRANLTAYTDSISAVFDDSPELAKSVMSILAATCYNLSRSAGQGRPGL